MAANSAAGQGFLYAIGGYSTSVTSTVLYAPITSNGTIGSWTSTTNLPAGIASSIGIYTGPTAFNAVQTGTHTLKSEDGGQQINKFDIGSATNVTGTQLFNFKVSSTIESVNISQIAFTLSNVTGFSASNVTSTELYIDYDGEFGLTVHRALRSVILRD